jgi:hypothetical protein
MDKEFQTTFIPKKSMTESSAAPQKRSRPLGIFSAIAILLFIIAVVSALVVFGYDRVIRSRVATLRASLETAEKQFEPNFIVTLQKLDARLRVSEDLLNQHVAVSPIFKVLENTALQGVQYDNFSYEVQPNGSALLEMSGLARRYQTIAEQSDLLGANRFVTDHIFSNFTLTNTGRVAFNLELTMSPELVFFARSLGEIPATNTIQVQTPTTQDVDTDTTSGVDLDTDSDIDTSLGIPSLDPSTSSSSSTGDTITGNASN